MSVKGLKSTCRGERDLFLKIGPGDFLIHHAIALGLHVTALILVKGTNNLKSSQENNNILRYYGVGAQIIKELGIRNMILVSRSKKRIIALKGYGIKIKKQEIIK